MAQKFRIATVTKVGETQYLGKRNKVDEDVFWSILKSKMKEETAHKSDEFEKYLTVMKAFFSECEKERKRARVAILDMWFEIEGVAETNK